MASFVLLNTVLSNGPDFWRLLGLGKLTFATAEPLFAVNPGLTQHAAFSLCTTCKSISQMLMIFACAILSFLRFVFWLMFALWLCGLLDDGFLVFALFVTIPHWWCHQNSWCSSSTFTHGLLQRFPGWSPSVLGWQTSGSPKLCSSSRSPCTSTCSHHYSTQSFPLVAGQSPIFL